MLVMIILFEKYYKFYLIHRHFTFYLHICDFIVAYYNKSYHFIGEEALCSEVNNGTSDCKLERWKVLLYRGYSYRSFALMVGVRSISVETFHSFPIPGPN